MSVKDQVLQAVHRLPDDVDFHDIAEEVAFLAAVREAEMDIQAGRTIPHEEMKVRIAKWSEG